MGGGHASRVAPAQLTRVTPGDLLGTPLILPNRAMVQSELASWFGETFDRQDIQIGRAHV